MYKKLAVLTPSAHADLQLLPVTNFQFLQDELAIPIVLDEIGDVAREYPIAYPRASNLPVALLGIEKGANAYVAPNGAWLASYLPAQLRTYPFSMAKVAPQSDAAAATDAPTDVDARRFVLLIDVESPFVGDTDGARIFDDKGALSELASERIQLMRNIQASVGKTQRLVEAMDKAGILTEQTVRIRRPGEGEREVRGLRFVDEKALNALPQASFNRLRTVGALPLVYASLVSWANFRRGPIGRSHPLETRENSDEMAAVDL